MADINVTNDSSSTTRASTTSTTNDSSWHPEEVPQLTVDVYRKGDVVFVVSTVAGVNPDDLDISIENNTLSIRGIRRKPYEESESDVLLEECFWGEFYRELTINENLDIERIAANLNQGVLVIEIPILRMASQKKIKVSYT